MLCECFYQVTWLGIVTVNKSVNFASFEVGDVSAALSSPNVKNYTVIFKTVGVINAGQ